MSKLRIADSLALPAEAVTQTFAILAKRGVGKTYTASVLVEEMLKAGLQAVVADPIGVWWGLRAAADGKGPGLPIAILGGDHGDVPLEVTAGSVIADLIVEEGIPAVLDLSLFRKNEQTRFMTDFAERLYHRNRKPLHLVLDEADAFCLSEDTEVLTTEGWARWDQIEEGKTLVSCFDLETGDYLFLPVQRVITREHNGEMVRLQTKRLDCLATPDHRVVLGRVQRAQGRYSLYDWTFCPADEVPTCVRVPGGGAPCGPGIAVEDDFLRLLGWIITDGFYHDRSKSNRLALQQSVTTVKLGKSIADEMSRLLEQYPGVKRYERPSRTGHSMGRTIESAPSLSWYFSQALSDAIVGWLSPDLHRIPRGLLNLCSEKQLWALFRGLMEGDGTARGGHYVAFYPGLNEGLANDFQELCARLKISSVKRFAKQIGQWQVNTAGIGFNHWVRKPKREHYEGLVWDITVPTGAFVARRNGRVFVTGNCPQRPYKGQERLLGAIEDLVRRGRARGIGVTLVTQRAAVINKDVLTQAEVLVTLRTIAPQDRDAIDAWIRVHGTPEQREELMQSLPSLPIGTAWFWSPGWLDIFTKVHVRARETFDSSATPKMGQAIRAPRQLAEIDLEALRSRIAGTIEKAKADDPKELRQRIAELEKQVRSGQSEPEVRVERVEVPVLSEAEIRAITTTIDAINHLGTQLTDLADQLARALQSALQRTQHVPEPRPRPKRADFASSSAPVGAAPPSSIEGNGDADGGLSRSERALLQALARRYPAAATISQLSTLSGRSAKSSTFLSAVSALTRAGHIERDGKSLVITEAGFDALGERPPAPMTPAEQIEMWRSALSRAERAIFEAIVERSPSEIRTEDIALATGYSVTSSSFLGALSVLKRNGLVEADNGDYRLSAELRGGGGARAI